MFGLSSIEDSDRGCHLFEIYRILVKVEELYSAILMAAKLLKKDGKGYEYPAIGRVVGLDRKIQRDRKRLLYMAGY